MMTSSQTRPLTLQKISVNGDSYRQMRRTVDLIGEAIKNGSRYLPIRNRAAQAAARAYPKDYLGQARCVFNDFVKRWRYIKDPLGRELVAVSPKSIYSLVMGGDSGIGVGDCDDASVAIGSQLASIGFPVRIATTAPEGVPPGRMFGHVFVQARIPGHGWVTVDPVVHPHHGFGYTPPHARIAFYDLTGKLLDHKGNARGLSGINKEIKKMGPIRQNIDEWTDYAGMGDCLGSYDPINQLPDFRRVGIKDYGIYADTMGMSGGLGLVAEVDTDPSGRAWTPMIELAPHDYQYLRKNKTPYHGMLGLGDNGETYLYDEGLGFFKKLFRKAKKAVHKIAKKALKALPGGKYLLKLGKKVWKISKKLVGPLAKIVGPLAKKLAPVAALIPGYGPAIAAALHTTGKIAGLMKKFGVVVSQKGDEPGKLRFPSDEIAQKFQSALKSAATVQKKQRKRKRTLIAKGVKPRRRARQAMRRMRPRTAQARAF